MLTDVRIDPDYGEALFSLETEGDISEVVNSQFGLHIIRLDGVRADGYKSFEEVKPVIIAEIEQEYSEQRLKEYVNQYSLSEHAKINHEVLERIFGPYKSAPGEKSE